MKKGIKDCKKCRKDHGDTDVLLDELAYHGILNKSEKGKYSLKKEFKEDLQRIARKLQDDVSETDINKVLSHSIQGAIMMNVYSITFQELHEYFPIIIKALIVENPLMEEAFNFKKVRLPLAD